MTERAVGPGRNAAHPRGFSWAAWRAVLRRTWQRDGEENIAIIAAGVAFYGTFSIFPGVAALIAVYGLLFDPADIRASLDALTSAGSESSP